MEEKNEKQPKTEAGWRARLKRNWSKGVEEAEYVSVLLPNGRKCQGGNQSWWLSIVKQEKAEGQNLSRYQKCRKDENYRIASLGCGVIAMTNLELYLEHRGIAGNEWMPADDGKSCIKALPKEDYIKAVRSKWKGTYRIGRGYVNYVTGLYPWKMEAGLRECLIRNHCHRTRVQWAPFAGKSKNRQKHLVWDTICDMLNADYPVVCSYHTFSPKEHALILYHELGLALRGVKAEGRYDKISSHYMTIIGCYVSETGCHVLQIESWGNLYYVRYDEYAEKLNYFTNILRIYE